MKLSLLRFILPSNAHVLVPVGGRTRYSLDGGRTWKEHEPPPVAAARRGVTEVSESGSISGAIAFGEGVVATKPDQVIVAEGDRFVELIKEAPTPSPAERMSLFTRRNSSGKVELCFWSITGAIQVIATEP